MRDRIHQPYRMDACPLLQVLLPLNGHSHVLGVALSGAGPSVLLIAEDEAVAKKLPQIIREAVNDPGLEILITTIAQGVLQG
jgi:homoserine kinase